MNALFERASTEMRAFLQGIRLSALIAHADPSGDASEELIAPLLPTVQRRSVYLTPSLD